jgi:hypothetical protein
VHHLKVMTLRVLRVEKSDSVLASPRDDMPRAALLLVEVDSEATRDLSDDRRMPVLHGGDLRNVGHAIPWHLVQTLPAGGHQQ